MSIIEDGGTIYNKTSAQRQAKADTQGEGVFDTDLNQLMYNDGSNWHSTYPIADPDLEDQPTVENLQLELREIQRANVNTGASCVNWTHGATVVNNGYNGGVYSPNQKRIYFAPYGQATQSTWHYIDCVTGEVKTYAYVSGMIVYAFWGGAYSPELDRIYFAPDRQSDESNWCYINCKTGVATSYAHGTGISTDRAYLGAVHSPTQARIYLVPFGIADESTWHYINCSTGAVTGYSHGVSAVNYGYCGGVYDPYNDYIWLMPYVQGAQSNWHYIDCSDGSVNAYAHGLSPAGNCAMGGAYDPVNNRVWLCPNGQAPVATWYYIDCETKTVTGYTHGQGTSLPIYAYQGCSYDPVLHRVWLSPSDAASLGTTWHYIDCATATCVAYTASSSTSDNYSGCIFDPSNNRTYFMPDAIADAATWHYIQSYAKESVSPQLMAHAMFNKTT